MPRYFFEISYNGTHYAGWQSQPNATGVQEVVENALSKLLRDNVKIVGSGRTDSGVHCEQQFFHVDLLKELDFALFLVRLNAFLPKDISINAIHRVKDEAHARYGAIERSYEYRITLKKNPFLEGWALYHFKSLDRQTMNQAAALLVGQQDFESFSKVKTDVNNFLCDVKRAEWEQSGDRLIFHISANRFLRGMVRAIVGTLLDVGSGKLSIKDFEIILKNRDRRKAGMNAPPHGLFLTKVKYPADLFIEK